MLRLIPFELRKIWQRRSFVLSVSFLLLIHIFLLWYTSLPNEDTPPLTAYKAVWRELSGKSETEKADYIADLKQTIDGVQFVQNVLAMKSFQNEMGKMLAEQELQDNPDVFEAYYNLYQSGDYLHFTDSPEQEAALIEELYEEQQKVSGYGDYLYSVQENKDTLTGISIFGGEEQDGYSAKNLQKSAADYTKLTDENICFTPSKGITRTMESIWPDLLLFLSVMMFAGGLITEEKEKKLLFITRCTKHGVLQSIGAKLSALLIHCILITVLFYSVSLVFFGQNTGWFHPDAKLQSLAPYMESSLSVSISGYIFLSVMTKALVLFGIGSLLCTFCLLSDITVIPFLIGTGIAGISMLLYSLIPAGSILAIFKYLNPVGVMKTENLYGNYLNFNLFGHPVSRLALSLALTCAISVAGIFCCLWLYCRMQNFEMRKLHLPFSLPFTPHVNIGRHESYKLLITNHALIILLLFASLLIFKSLDRSYTPSVEEQYYMDIMMQLEGSLTDDKEQLILSEQKRYNKSLQKIEQIDEMVNAGDLDSDAADTLKAQEYMILSFYPSFQRVEEQYQHIQKYGGSFVYDTGYLYLFGILEDAFSVDFLILTVGIILAVSGIISMEYQTGALFLLCASKEGKRRIFAKKILICICAVFLLALVPIICRAFHIAAVYPMHSFSASVQNISYFSGFAMSLPIGLFLLLFAIFQTAVAVLAALITLALSLWRKNQAQTIFFALLLLAVPIILKQLGFEIAKWFSLYPLYGWTGNL